MIRKAYRRLAKQYHPDKYKVSSVMNGHLKGSLARATCHEPEAQSTMKLLEITSLFRAWGSRVDILEHEKSVSKASYSYYSVPGVAACWGVSKCCLGSLGRFHRGGKASFATAVTSLWKRGPEILVMRLRNLCERSCNSTWFICNYNYTDCQLVVRTDGKQLVVKSAQKQSERK